MLAHSDEDDAKPSRSFEIDYHSYSGIYCLPDRAAAHRPRHRASIIGMNPTMGVTSTDTKNSVPGLALQLAGPTAVRHSPHPHDGDEEAWYGITAR